MLDRPLLLSEPPLGAAEVGPSADGAQEEQPLAVTPEAQTALWPGAPRGKPSAEALASNSSQKT